MEHENSRFADEFAHAVDQAYERGTDLDLSDEEFRVEIFNALDQWLGKNMPDII